MIDFIPIVTALEKRAEKIQRFSCVHLYCSPYGWRANASFTKLEEAFPDPHAAIRALDKELARLEDADGNLARTLGIAA